MKKIPILLLFLFIKAACFAQTTITDSIPGDITIIVSLAGNANSLTQAQLDTGFYIQTSNPAIKIIQFRMGYLVDTADHCLYQEQVYMGNKGFINKKYPKIAYETSLGGGRIFIDNILVERNGKRYLAKAFIITVKLPPRSLKQLKQAGISGKGFTR